MKNISKMKLIPFLIYLILIISSIGNNSFEFKVLGFIFFLVFVFEYINLKISKIIINYWKNQKSKTRNLLDNQCFFGLSNSLLLYWSGYLFTHGIFEHIFLGLMLIIFVLLIDRIIQAYICKNSKATSCYPSCETFSKIFCYYTKEQSSENDNFEDLHSQEKPLHALVISIRVMLLSIALIILYLILDEQSEIKQTLASGGVVAIVIGFVFRAQINTMLIGAKLFFRNAFHINDWIEVPNLNIDGIIREINSFSVVVENWDKTKTNIPIEKFSEYSFKNWQNLNKENMRRIKRSILIDLNSVRELSKNEIIKLKEKKVLKDYLEQKEKELELLNNSSENKIERKLTNLGTFRVFIEKYLQELQKSQHHIGIAPHDDKDIRVMVRQLDPTEFGLPLEIYTFASTTNWKKFEDIQSDLFDYIFVSMKDFDLKIFQVDSKY
jgi:miniconductance mechanosensitive channel